MRRGDAFQGSVALVFLPLKYEIDDSVTVTVVLLGDLIIGYLSAVVHVQSTRQARLIDINAFHYVRSAIAKLLS